MKHRFDEFFEKYNMSKSYFTRLVHVALSTFNDYLNGKKINDLSEYRIEKGYHVIVENDLVRPFYDKNKCTWTAYNSQHDMEMCDYERTFDDLFKEECLKGRGN